MYLDKITVTNMPIESTLVCTMYSGLSLKGHSLERTLLYKGTNIWQQVLEIHVMFPLTKGYLSNKDRISWQKGCPY